MQKKGENARIFILAFINKNEKITKNILNNFDFKIFH